MSIPEETPDPPVASGEITELPNGDVVIGAPPATAIAVPTEDSD